MPRLTLFAHHSFPPPPPAPHRRPPYLTALLVSFPILIATAAAASFLLFLILRCRRRLAKPRHDSPTHLRNDLDAPASAAPSFRRLHRFSYRELRRATDCFHESRKLGKGGYGVVYHGLLRDGTEVAVKKMILSSAQGEREFQNELSICKRLDSRYVVKLLGFSSHGDKVRLLVYECMKNRSLQEALLEKNAPVLLDWQMRFNIISDIARALSYLHVDCKPPVIHGDVKPSNILLDGSFCAYLADFGLARLKVGGLDPTAAMAMAAEQKGRSDASEAEMGTPEEDKKLQNRVRIAAPDADLLSLPSSSYLGSPHSAKRHSTDAQPPPDYSPLRQALIHPQDGSSPPLEQKIVSADPSSPHLHQEFPLTPTHFAADSTAPPSLPARRSSQKGIPGKYWWWKQEYSGELKVRDYVMEWMRSELSASETKVVASGFADRAQEEEAAEQQRKEAEERRRMRRGKWRKEAGTKGKQQEEKEVAEARSRRERSGGGGGSSSSSSNSSGRKSREWWKDEYFAELSRKKKKKKRKNKEGGGGAYQWAEAEAATAASDDLSSTTTSMRGTVCYVAPEFGGGGAMVVSEASDIYSFGVLLLVIISGRRPIEIMTATTPTSPAVRRFERANLISWARSLANSGNVLELVDDRLQGAFPREQAQLCIALALSCIRCLPTARPTITSVLKILQGEAPPPSIPLEFSPSPPSRLSSSSPYYYYHRAPSFVSSADDLAA